MAFDFKKEYKEFYMPKSKPEIVQVPKANYIAIRGQGDPNEADGAYQQAIGVLYAVAYTLKMSYKTEHKIEGFFGEPVLTALSCRQELTLCNRAGGGMIEIDQTYCRRRTHYVHDSGG